MFVVIVNLDVAETRLEEFLAAIEINAHATLRDEPGCLRFDVHRSVEDPHHFMFYEIYTDADAFYVAHRSAPHYVAWREASARCVRAGTQVNTYLEPAFPADILEAETVDRS
ncbi:putative quinol monooxygenase [Nocardioides sp. CER19]|uniref:putative quinol monooxygenase n=1 Tax=Nocardioides sp. CER19 TaxID=3038538 RepID=UPI00244C315F|nr:putative quinol monooxygenase [Nocardioides sp. CER19]MDH2416094.1 putative quinol monooxygenase [Nocardioides sp. CER19]